MNISKLLNKKINRTIFTTPSHNQKPIFSCDLNAFYKKDYSEIEGFDNLAKPTGTIMMSQGLISDIFKTKQTFYITQGATTAMLCAVKTLINPLDKVLVARNCHKSVFNAMILSAGIIDWFMPDCDEDWGIYTKIDTQKLESTLKLNNYKAFIVTSPTYEGVNSNIKEISEICKKYNVYLIVDEAHGSLYNFSSKLPMTAIEQGADVSINSLHKTAGALNQTALLHISSNIRHIDITQFQKCLNIFQTSSPSYPLLANIEECILFLNSKNGQNEIEKLIKNIEYFKNDLIKHGINFYNNSNQDPTKILLQKQGISGFDLSDKLFEEFNIEDEISNVNSCLYLTGIGTSKSKLNLLKKALINLKTTGYEFKKCEFQPYPIVKIQPIDTFNKNYIYVDKQNSINKISNSTIMPYPPGIGLLYPGELIQNWHLNYLPDDVEIFS